MFLNIFRSRTERQQTSPPALLSDKHGLWRGEPQGKAFDFLQTGPMQARLRGGWREGRVCSVSCLELEVFLVLAGGVCECARERVCAVLDVSAL